MRALQLGKTQIRIINIGDIVLNLKETENVPVEAWRPKYSDLFENELLFPSQSVLFLSPDSEPVLVDAGDYSLSFSRSPYFPSQYTPPPGLLQQLESSGVAPEAIRHVIITHAHFDHYSGITKKNGNSYVPAFPNAKYYLGQADFEDPRIRKELENAESQESRTLGVVDNYGMLELVEGSLFVTKEIQLIPSPGESPGHQIVRFDSSDGEIFYCLGDLFHHSVEIENLSWMAPWDDFKTSLESRNRLVEEALGEDAWLLAAHMNLGKLRRDGLSLKFVEM